MRDYDEFKRDFSNMNLLARGGQKIVYSATHPQYGAIVIEFYFNLDDPRSKREIEIVKLVELQCVPRLFETGEILHEGSKTLYVVEEQILGYVLRERIASGERFTLIEAVNCEKSSIGPRNIVSIRPKLSRGIPRFHHREPEVMVIILKSSPPPEFPRHFAS